MNIQLFMRNILNISTPKTKNIEEYFIILILFLSTSGGGIPLISAFRENVSTSGDTLLQIIWSIIYLIIIALTIRHWRLVKSHFYSNLPIIILTVFALLSSIWSMNPELSLRRSIALIGTTFVGFYLGSICTIRNLLKMSFIALTVCTITSLIVIYFFPDVGLQYYDGMYVWRGIYGHKNHFGRIIFFAILIYFLFSINKTHFTKALIFLFSLFLIYFLFASYSTTSILLLFVGLSILPILLLKRLDFRFKGAAISISLCILIIFSFFLQNITLNDVDEFLWNHFGKDCTLAGRTIIWELCFHYIKNSLLFGYGYDAFWFGGSGPAKTIKGALGFEVAHGHNGIIDLLLQLGLIGAFLFFIIFIQFLYRAIQNYKFRKNDREIERIFPLVFLFSFVGLNLTESMILTRNYFFWILFISLLVMFDSSKYNFSNTFSGYTKFHGR